MLIGRKKEISILNKVFSSKSSEFVAVYGRRRIGKTYLIQQCITKQAVYLEYTGLKDGALNIQLANFAESLAKTFGFGLALIPSKSWKEAFTLLTHEVQKVPKTKKIIIFLDELPWISSPKSAFLQNLDHFWNTTWSKIPNFKLVVCGSAASWMLSHLINAKGGLHNRLTKTILLEPFSLLETEQFLESKKFKLSRKQILDLYMVMGGVPYYLNQLDASKSINQNINQLFFIKGSVLYDEFSRLFKSLFDSSDLHVNIVKEIAKKHYGVSFSELAEGVGKKAGGRFQERLQELEACGFIEKFLPYGKKKRDHYYKVVDEYTLFYLKWIASLEERGTVPKGVDYWSKISKSPSYASWVGYIFENICYKHIEQVIRALGLTTVGCLVSHFTHKAVKDEKDSCGVQIDLLLDRDDDAITICEIKHSSVPFIIDKSYAKNLMNKLEVFEKQPKQVFLVLISTFGVKKNTWSEELISDTVTLEDLFIQSKNI